MAKKFVNGEWIEYGQEVTLTGSNVEIDRKENIIVTAGSVLKNVIPNTDVTKFRSLYGYVVSNNGSHSMAVWFNNVHKKDDGSFMTIGTWTYKSGSASVHNSGNVGVQAQFTSIDIYNTDTVDHNYDVLLGGTM